MKWYILGGGSIGRLLAASLSRVNGVTRKSDIKHSQRTSVLKDSPKLLTSKREGSDVILLLREKRGENSVNNFSSAYSKLINKNDNYSGGMYKKTKRNKRVYIDVLEQYKECPTSFTAEVDYESVPSASSNFSSSSKIERLIVTTKAYDVFGAIQGIQDRLSRNAVIIIFANGKGFYEKLSSFNRFQSMTFISAVIDHGAMIPECTYEEKANHHNNKINLLNWQHKGEIREVISDTCRKVLHVNHTGKGSIMIGLRPMHPVGYKGIKEFPNYTTDSALLKEIQSFFNYSAHLRCMVVSNIEEIIWQKFCANICINGLTTLYEKKNGDIVHDITCRYIITHLCYEVSALMKLELDQLHFSNDKKEIWRKFDGPYLEKYVLEVARRTARNESSMLRDYTLGRKTELENLHGYMIDLQKSKYMCTLALPMTKFLYTLLSKKLSDDIK